MHPNYEETRQLFLRNTLNALAQQYAPEVMKAVQPAIKEMIDTTYTDEVLFQDFQRMATEKRAKEAAYWNEYYAADAAKKAAKTHQDRLAVAHGATEVERGRADEAEDKVRELNRVLDDGSH
jgi:phage portal protein BeeE